MSSHKASGDMFLAVTALLALTVTTIKADCHQPLPPTNGYVTSLSGRIPAGRVARIICNRHYKFHGTNDSVRDIRCLPNGQWDTYPPCQATVTCDTPPSKAGGSWILTGRGPGDQYSVTRARATFRCNPGHFLVDPRNHSVPQEPVVYCGNDLHWIRRIDNPGFRCLALRECSKHPPASGTLAMYPIESEKFVPGTNVWFFCKPGYFFRRIETKMDYHYYDYVSYGYEMQDTQTKVTYEYDTDNRSLECMGPHWSGPMPTCIAFTCPVPTVRDGKWNTNQHWIKHGEVINMTCDTGYLALGPPSIKCSMQRANDKDGWDLDPPSCKEIRCVPPERPERGFVSYMDHRDMRRQGAVIHIICNRDFVLNGSQTRRCMKNGRWSGRDATCQPTRAQDISHCPVPVIPYGGRKYGDSYNVGDVVTYACQNGYIGRGPCLIKCKYDQWEPAGQPRCEGLFSFDDPEKLAGNFGRVFDAMNKTGDYLDTRGRRFDLNAPDGFDITFLIDSSGSITQQEFNDAIKFVKLFVEKVGVSLRPDGARIAAASFADDPREVLALNNGFLANSPKPVEMIKALLDRLQYSGETDINGALAHYRMNMIPLSRKMRAKAKQYLFILSDGKYNRAECPVESAKELRGDPLKVEIFSVKIGNDKKTGEARKNTQVLIDMSSEKEMNVDGTAPHYFNLQSYATFDYLVQKLLNGSIDYGECGVAGKTGITLGNIIGGNLAKPRAWPWMVAVRVAARNDLGVRDHKHVCGGTVLNNEWILTSAQCFQGYTYNNPRRVMVKLGANKMTQSQADDPVYVRDVRVRSMHIHEAWIVNAEKKKVNDNWANDIALLRLADKIQFSRSVRPICLIPKNAPDKDIQDEIAVVTGWGKAGNESLTSWQAYSSSQALSTELRQVRLPVVTHAENPSRCYNRYQAEKVICAGSTYQVIDACVGDAGGPLMIELGAENNKPRWYQIGIVSSGFGCASLDRNVPFGRYTDVRKYRDWIEATVRNAGP
ncbi:complement C2-like [Lineus longissimus]|uniref:complement C2-like n=1 Tax=Lineus longissimus TaxID=88925 RepID=UPI002B4F94E8